jgi:hypothetical protein
MDNIAKTLLISGFILIVAGLVWHFSGGKIPLGRLPGDIRIESENSSFYFPLTTCLILSAILSLLGYFFRK